MRLCYNDTISWLAWRPTKSEATGRFSGWARIFSSLFSILMLNYFIENGQYQNDWNGQPLTFHIQLCLKYIGVVRFGPPERELVR